MAPRSAVIKDPSMPPPKLKPSIPKSHPPRIAPAMPTSTLTKKPKPLPFITRPARKPATKPIRMNQINSIAFMFID